MRRQSWLPPQALPITGLQTLKPPAFVRAQTQQPATCHHPPACDTPCPSGSPKKVASAITVAWPTITWYFCLLGTPPA